MHVHDIARSRRFYEELLGFEPRYIHPDESDPGYVSFDYGESGLGIVRADDPRVVLWVYVDDVDAAVEKLRTGGATITREPEDMPWGERVADVEDPDGYTVMVATASRTPSAP
jgi:lactoylglutathione lyase